MILELLESLQGESGLHSKIQSISKECEKLREINLFAKEQFTDETSYILKPEAATYAKDNVLPPEVYTKILRLFTRKLLANVVSQKNSEDASSLINAAFDLYKTKKITLEQIIAERSIQLLAKNYHHFKDKVRMEDLLLMNPSEDLHSAPAVGAPETPAVGSKQRVATTFVHALIEAQARREDIIHFFKEFDEFLPQDTQELAELRESYLDLNTSYVEQGKVKGPFNIRNLIAEVSVSKHAYAGLYERLAPIFARQYGQQGRQEVNINTHTASVHGSVDASFVRLALRYDSEKVAKESDRVVTVERTSNWQEGIDAQIDAFHTKLTAALEDNESISSLIEERDPDKIKKFKFQGMAALRLLDGLMRGRFGGTYEVKADEVNSCGLSVKEMVSIAFASLNDREKWENQEQAGSQFAFLVENLYIAKRGYNIDAYGDDEWKTHPEKPDDNKCRGGTINQIACGLRDHKDVEVKIITAETMLPPVSGKLQGVLRQLSKSKEGKTLIRTWFASGIISKELSDKILAELCKDADFSKEFSQSEITSIGATVLAKYDIDSLRREFPDLNQGLDKKKLIYTFTFEEGKGYVPYLQALHRESPEELQPCLMGF